jgi:hypothetical protein
MISAAQRPVHLVGTALWSSCGRGRTTGVLSTSRRVTRLQHVLDGGPGSTVDFVTQQQSRGVHPQSTAPINTINHVHHRPVEVIAAFYTDADQLKDKS